MKSDLNCDLFNSIDLTSGFDSFLSRIGLTGETHYDIADVLALSSELFMPLKLFKLKVGKSSSKLGFWVIMSAHVFFLFLYDEFLVDWNVNLV